MVVTDLFVAKSSLQTVTVMVFPSITVVIVAVEETGISVRVTGSSVQLFSQCVIVLVMVDTILFLETAFVTVSEETEVTTGVPEIEIFLVRLSVSVQEE